MGAGGGLGCRGAQPSAKSCALPLTKKVAKDASSGRFFAYDHFSSGWVGAEGWLEAREGWGNYEKIFIWGKALRAVGSKMNVLTNKSGETKTLMGNFLNCHGYATKKRRANHTLQRLPQKEDTKKLTQNEDCGGKPPPKRPSIPPTHSLQP